MSYVDHHFSAEASNRDAHWQLREHLLKRIKRRRNVASQARPEIILLLGRAFANRVVIRNCETMIRRSELSFGANAGCGPVWRRTPEDFRGCSLAALEASTSRSDPCISPAALYQWRSWRPPWPLSRPLGATLCEAHPSSARGHGPLLALEEPRELVVPLEPRIVAQPSRLELVNLLGDKSRVQPMPAIGREDPMRLPRGTARKSSTSRGTDRSRHSSSRSFRGSRAPR